MQAVGRTAVRECCNAWHMRVASRAMNVCRTILILPVIALFACSTLTADWKSVAPGVEYRHFAEPGASIHVTRVDLTDERIRVIASDAASRGATVGGFAQRTRAIVAVNGDYFDEARKPVGLAIGPCGVWEGTRDTAREGFLAIGRTKAEIYPQANVVDPPEAWMESAVSGWPMIVTQCRALSANELPGSDHFTRAPHPRTAAGLSADGTSLFLVVADGRRPEVPGPTLAQLAAFMRSALGVCEAINLDGGGSSEMVVRGTIVNTPSDGAERPVGNHLAVVLAEDVPECAAGTEPSAFVISYPK